MPLMLVSPDSLMTGSYRPSTPATKPAPPIEIAMRGTISRAGAGANCSRLFPAKGQSARP